MAQLREEVSLLQKRCKELEAECRTSNSERDSLRSELAKLRSIPSLLPTNDLPVNRRLDLDSLADNLGREGRVGRHGQRDSKEQDITDLLQSDDAVCTRIQQSHKKALTGEVAPSDPLAYLNEELVRI